MLNRILKCVRLRLVIKKENFFKYIHIVLKVTNIKHDITELKLDHSISANFRHVEAYWDMIVKLHTLTDFDIRMESLSDFQFWRRNRKNS